MWGIVLKETGRLIGSIGVVHEDDEPGRLEVGYCIGRAYWGRRYTTEALRGIIGYLSEKIGVKRFMAKHAEENPASGAVLRHVGFRHVGDGSYKSFDGRIVFKSKRYYLDIE